MGSYFIEKAEAWREEIGPQVQSRMMSEPDLEPISILCKIFKKLFYNRKFQTYVCITQLLELPIHDII